MIAGAGAGCMSSLITCPLDVAKTRLQYNSADHHHYRGPFGCFSFFLSISLFFFFSGLSPLSDLAQWQDREKILA